MLAKRHQVGYYRFLVTLALLSTSFVAAGYMLAPWHLNVMDFLVRPIIECAVPVLVIGMLVTRMAQSIEHMWLFGLPLLVTSALGIFLQTGWPPSGLPTSWEDSYQTLFILEMFTRGICWPVWLITVLVLLRSSSNVKRYK